MDYDEYMKELDAMDSTEAAMDSKEAKLSSLPNVPTALPKTTVKKEESRVAERVAELEYLVCW